MPDPEGAGVPHPEELGEPRLPLLQASPALLQDGRGKTGYFFKGTVLVWIRIRRIHMFLGLLDLTDPLVRGMDPDPSIIKQKC